MSAPDAVIRAVELTKTYRMGEVDVHALNGASLEIYRGEVVAITGPSGSGKSTMMNILGCLDRPTSGEYYLDGEPIMNQLFADLWGSSFTEAGRRLLLSRLEGEGALSEEFGPGFYGMESIQMKEVGKILDTGRIGVEVRESGILVPIKSCGGISFRVGEGYLRLSSECADCRGNRSGCSQCSVRINLNLTDKETI